MNDKVTVKKGEDLAGKAIINNLIIRPVHRTRADVQSWRNYHRTAEYNQNGSRVQLYDLMDDAMLDPTLSSVVEKRIMGVTNTPIRFVKDGKDVDDINKLFKTQAGKKLLKEIMLSKMWGITVAEITFDKDVMKLYSVPRKHIRPKMGTIVYEQTGVDGFSYREGMFAHTMLEVGDADDLGILLKAIPFVLYKRGAMGDWAQMSEIFGMPTKIGRYSGSDEATRLQLESALDDAGAALSITIPEEAKIEFLESKTTGDASKIYEALKNACNEELAILILGQTETTRSSESSGYAQAKVHGQTEDDINLDDRDFVMSVLESKFTPILRAAGYAVEGGEWMFEDPEENLTLSQRKDIDIALKVAGLPMDDDYFYERYNIPKPVNYEAQKKEAEAKAEKKATEKKPGNKPDPTDGEDEDVKQERKLFDKFRALFP